MTLLAELRKRDLLSKLVENYSPDRRNYKQDKTSKATRELANLQRLAERLEPALRRVFLAAVAKVQNSIDLEKLAAAINANQLTAAEAAAQISTFPEVYGGLAAELRAGFLAGSGLAIRELAQQGISLSFNLINPEAVAYASRATLDLVQPFQQNAKETIRTFLAKAASGETTASGAAKDIRDLIGLDPNRVRRADSFWQKLVEQDVAERDIARRVGNYMEALVRERAEVIARNELHKAAGAGQQAAWDIAASKGLIDTAEWSKVWVVTWDEALCDLCEPMDGTAVGVDESFDTPNGPQDFPDMHVQCRCTANLVKTDEVARYVDSLNRPDEKPQSRREFEPLQKYSDDQARDDHGRWTNGPGAAISADDKNRVLVYHGTVSSVKAQILKHGLKSNYSGGRIWVSTKESTARRYAELGAKFNSSHGKADAPLIIQASIPRDIFRSAFAMENHDDKEKPYFTRTPIRAGWIRGFKEGKKEPDDFVDVWAAVVVHEV